MAGRRIVAIRSRLSATAAVQLEDGCDASYPNKTCKNCCRCCHERTFKNRVDGSDMEPGPRLHQDQPRMQALLRRNLRGAIPGRPGPPLWRWLRPTTRP